jgi:hypothetical protein
MRRGVCLHRDKGSERIPFVQQISSPKEEVQVRRLKSFHATVCLVVAGRDCETATRRLNWHWLPTLLAENLARASHALQRRIVHVAEHDPYVTPGGADPNRESAAVEPPRRPTWTTSRIILIALLLVCLGMLGVDVVRGQWPLSRDRKRLVDAMAARSPPDDEQKGPAKGPIISGDLSPLTVDEVHKIVGREPSESVTLPAKLGESKQIVETYAYPGVFQRYSLKCTYYVTPKELGGSALKRVDSASGWLSR